MDIVKFFHSNDIVHSDIKPSNILTDNNKFNQLYIIDYAGANKLLSDLKTFTDNYLSPEIFIMHP